MRGTRIASSKLSISYRFIPAYAGNALMPIPISTSVTVHPRVCGERYDPIVGRPCSDGSSPRMRGTLPNPPVYNHSSRFIPAYAGNAISQSTDERLHTVHPRVCGERLIGALDFRADAGSSPRMRGTHSRGSKTRSGGRFIPAYAGNAQARRSRPPRSPVHPRVCGERVWAEITDFDDGGSSPRMRGTLACWLIAVSLIRFIPAYAGNATSTDA